MKILALANGSRSERFYNAKNAERDQLLEQAIASAKHLFEEVPETRNYLGYLRKQRREELPGEPERRCVKCGDWAPEHHEFFGNTKGVMHWACRECGLEAAARYRQSEKKDVDRAARSLAGQKARQARRKAGEQFTKADVDAKWTEQAGLCFYCGRKLNKRGIGREGFHTPAGKFHVDHYEPLAQGGDSKSTNIVLACPPCNLGKQSKTAEEWIELLKSRS